MQFVNRTVKPSTSQRAPYPHTAKSIAGALGFNYGGGDPAVFERLAASN